MIGIESYNFFKPEDLENDVKIILEKRYNFVIMEFEKSISHYKYETIVGDEFKRLYIIDSKYCVFVGLMFYPYNRFNQNYYNSMTDEIYLKRNFTIFINEVIWDNNLKINFNKLINLIECEFSSPEIFYQQTDQYLERNFKEKISFMVENKDKFFTIAEYFKSKINLYDYLINNQDIQIIEDNWDYMKLLIYFEKICKLYENEIKNFKYKVYYINKHEKIYLLEDSFVMYVGAKGMNALFGDKDRKDKTITYRYCIVFQELTFNNLYDTRKFSKFVKNIKNVTSSITRSTDCMNLFYRPFAIGNTEEKILKGYRTKFYNKSNFKNVNDKLPEIKLQNRFDEWEGTPKNYIVYEFIYYKNEIGYAITPTSDSNPRLAAVNLMKKYEKKHGHILPFKEIIYDDTWNVMLSKYIDEQKETNWDGYKVIREEKSFLAEKVQYFIVPYYITNNNINTDITGEIIKNAKVGLYNDLDRTLYDITGYKWKSEELMYVCIKKVFPKKNVIHQYRPYFLGKQSYDVYVCGTNIAFEYQGKQHFEPVKLFGGESAFEKNKKRDEIKAKLSKENGVKLIYINYWEEITVDLIKNKIREYNEEHINEKISSVYTK